MKRGAISVSPMHPMANGLNVLANSSALHLRNDYRTVFKASKSGRAWGRNFVIHADQRTTKAENRYSTRKIIFLVKYRFSAFVRSSFKRSAVVDLGRVRVFRFFIVHTW